MVAHDDDDGCKTVSADIMPLPCPLYVYGNRTAHDCIPINPYLLRDVW